MFTPLHIKPRAVSLMCSSISRHTHQIRCKSVLVLDILVLVLSRNVLPQIPCFMWKKAYPGLCSLTQDLLTSFFNTSRRACDQSRKPIYWRASCEERRLQHVHAAIHCDTFEVSLIVQPGFTRPISRWNQFFMRLRQSQDCRLVPHHHNPTFQQLADVFPQSEGQDETHDTSNDVLSDFNSAPSM